MVIPRWATLLLLAFAVIGCVSTDAKQEHSLGAIKHLLPYVQASQVPMSTGGIWISDHEVAFNVRKPGVMEMSQAERNEIQEGSDPDNFHWDYTRWSEVWILDIRTGKTWKYMDGGLGSFHNGEITVVLHSYRPRRLQPGLSRFEQGYTELSEGRIGEEKRRIKPASLIKFHPKKCPGEPEGSKTRIRYQLKPEHGCLDVRSGEPTNLPALYYRSDGKVIELNMPRADIENVPTSVTNWVEWLGAYLLKDSTIGCFGANGCFRANGYFTQTIHLMKPDGSLLAVPLNAWSVGNIRPTRVGIVGDRGGGRISEDGLYLWRDSSILQISEGFTAVGDDVSYSPDGCKVSYRSYARRPGFVAKHEDYRLRVIDLCNAFNLPSNANPFVWPETSNQ